MEHISTVTITLEEYEKLKRNNIILDIMINNKCSLPEAINAYVRRIYELTNYSLFDELNNKNELEQHRQQEQQKVKLNCSPPPWSDSKFSWK